MNLATLAGFRHLICSCAVGVALTSCATMPQSDAANEVLPAPLSVAERASNDRPQNANIQRVIRGRYDYVSLATQEVRGTESFVLIAHPDGTRTVTASTDIFSRDVQVNTTLRVAADFRPIEAFVQTHTKGRMKGSGLFRVEGDKLRELVVGTAGTVDRHVDAPPAYAIAAHPVVTDGWTFWQGFGSEGTSLEISIYNIDGFPKFEEHMVGKFEQYQVRYLGMRIITTPAGTFETEGYAVGDNLYEAWVTGEDKLLVEMTWPRFQTTYVLSEYSLGSGV